MITYETPFIDISLLTNIDITNASGVGTEMSRQDESNPIWGINVGG